MISILLKCNYNCFTERKKIISALAKFSINILIPQIHLHMVKMDFALLELCTWFFEFISLALLTSGGNINGFFLKS